MKQMKHKNIKAWKPICEYFTIVFNMRTYVRASIHARINQFIVVKRIPLLSWINLLLNCMRVQIPRIRTHNRNDRKTSNEFIYAL